jgi:penicillin-binding protein 2
MIFEGIQLDVKKIHHRLRIFTWLVICVFLYLTIGLTALQLVKGGEYEKLAQENRIRIIPITAPRGVFTDREGRELVNNRPSFTVSYMNVNSEAEEQKKVFSILSEILHIPLYTDVVDERYVVNDEGVFTLKQLPIVDLNGDGETNSEDIKIIHETTGNELIPEKVHINTGKVELDAKKDTAILVTYRYDTFKHKLRDQGYKKYLPVRLKTDVDFATVAKIEEKNLPGVVIQVEPIRNYIYKETGAHIFGYVGEINNEELDSFRDKGYRPGDLIGKTGLEKTLEQFLKGKDGGQQVEVTATGNPIEVLGQVDPVPGHSINLTIDMKLQQIAENTLKDQMLKLQTAKNNPFPNAKRGAVVALNVKTGEVLAMVSIPSFDPNMFARGITQIEWDGLVNNPLKPLVNQTIASTYPPGSIFKMVTATAALENKMANERESIYCRGVYWTIASKKDWKPGGHGSVNIIKAIAESCNIFFYEMGRRVGIDEIEKYARMYGFGELTGIELAGEKAGSVAGREYKKSIFKSSENKRWYPAETLDAAIGQGFHSFTPLQVADYIAALANKGFWMKPHLIKSIVDENGNVVLEKKPEIGGQVEVSEETLDIIRKGMLGVTQPGGTAYSVFADFPISVAAKTGTAQWDVTKTPHGWFAAFAPYEDPEIAVVVFIEQAGSGGSTGGPVAKAILESYFHLHEDDEKEDYMIQR